MGIRKEFGDFVSTMTNVELPSLDTTTSLIDYNVTLPHAQWVPWMSQVPAIELNTHSITQIDVIIPTVDTVRHEDVLYSWLAEHKTTHAMRSPQVSGKTMTLFSALRKLPDMEVVGLNFSSATQPDLVIKDLRATLRVQEDSKRNGLVPNTAWPMASDLLRRNQSPRP